MQNSEVYSVVLPTLNERPNLEILLPRIIELSEISFIVIVDDNSTDGTLDYLDRLNETKVHLLHRPRRLGIGSAHLDGIIFARDLGASVIITMDADGTHRVEDVANFLKVRIDYDVLVGSRYLDGGAIRGWRANRILLTKLGHMTTKIFFRSELDMSSGMRAYRTSKIPFDNLRKFSPADYSFFFVSLLLMKKSFLKIEQIPITLDSRNFGKSKMSLSLMIKGVSTLFKYGLRIKMVNQKRKN